MTAPATVAHYARMADRIEPNYHEVQTAYAGRITPSEGAFGRAWMKFNPGVQLVWINDADGVPRALTPKQYQVYQLAAEMVEGPMHTMRDMAALLHVAPSTVSRALAKLQAWGIIAYIVGRGRWAGLVIIRRAKGDGLDRFRKAAQARVRRWKEAAQRRFSRLAFNVAPYLIDGGREYLVPVISTSTTTRYKGATLTTQRSWTADEVADIR